jgi:hypothetical protein
MQVELLNCTHLVGASVRRYGAWLRPGQSVNQLCTGLQEMLAPFLAEGVVYRALAQRPSVASMKRSTTALQQLRAATVELTAGTLRVGERHRELYLQARGPRITLSEEENLLFDRLDMATRILEKMKTEVSICYALEMLSLVLHSDVQHAFGQLDALSMLL